LGFSLINNIINNNNNNNNNNNKNNKTMIKINEIPVGFPAKTANGLEVSVITFKSDALTANTYWQLFSNVTDTVIDEEGKEIEEVKSTLLADGNYELTEAQYKAWGANNSVVEDAVLSSLGLTRA
jgi:hypothetical protein